MQESWFHVGAPVLIATGPFAGLDAVVQTMDTAADTVSVIVKILGRRLSLTFPLSAATHHLARFEDQPPVQSCPYEETHKQELLSLNPEADTIYRSRFPRSMMWMVVQVAQYGTDRRLMVRTHNLTWPAREKMQWTMYESPLAAEAWDDFTQIVEACGFWRLPYDDGHRVMRDEASDYWELEGWQRGCYHAVVRRGDRKRSEIADCCDYLLRLVETSATDAEPRTPPDRLRE